MAPGNGAALLHNEKIALPLTKMCEGAALVLA